MRISDWSSDVCSSDLPDEARVGEQLQPQPHPHFLSRPAGSVLERRAVGAGLVARIAAPAIDVAEEGEPYTLSRQVGERAAILIVVVVMGAARDLGTGCGVRRPGAGAPASGGGRGS